MNEQTIGRFTVVSQLGEGRLGRLYEGVETATRIPVCVRQLDMRLLADSAARDRTAQTVRSLASLSSPDIVRIVDLLESGPEWFLITELVAGVALCDLLDPARAAATGVVGGDLAAAAAVLEDAGRGCLALHAAGLAHGALGPSSVLVGVDGRARLVDPTLLSAMTSTPASRDGDARSWAELSRALSRAWLTTRDAAIVERAAGDADGNDLAGAVALVARLSATGRGGLAAAVRAWWSTRMLGTPFYPTHMPSAPPAQRATILDAPGGETSRGLTILEQRPLVAATSRGATVADRAQSATAGELGIAAPEVGGLPRYRLGAPAHPVDDGRVRAGIVRNTGGTASSSLLVNAVSRGALEPAWPPPRRTGRSAGNAHVFLGAAAAMAAVLIAGVVLGLLARSGGSLEVTGSHVAMAQTTVPCNGTADARGTVDVNGEAGTVDYSWELSTGASTGGLRHEVVSSGQRELTVELRWDMSSGTPEQGTVTLVVSGPQSLPDASASFTYQCTA